nr:MAG TPA: hypothetical protein [Caudoviricetes sp.]
MIVKIGTFGTLARPCARKKRNCAIRVAHEWHAKNAEIPTLYKQKTKKPKVYIYVSIFGVFVGGLYGGDSAQHKRR